MVRPDTFRRGRNSRSGSIYSSSRRRTVKSVGGFKFRLRENAGALNCKENLKSSFLNIDGLSEAKFEDMSKTVQTKSPDLFFLLETKRRIEEIASDISLPGYDLAELRRSDASGDKPGGGIAFYLKNTAGLLFKRHNPAIAHADLEYVQQERFWVTIDSLSTKTAYCGVYMACQRPDDKYGEWNEGIYWVLRQESAALRTAGYRVVILGDMNCHVGCAPGQGVPGNTADINRNGERYLSFLEDSDMRHINGELKTPGVLDSRYCSGLWTRQRGASRSIIDFVSLSSEHIGTIVSMTVDEDGTHGGGSDHNWIDFVLADKFRRLVPLRKPPTKKQIWNLSGNFEWSDFRVEVVKHLPAICDIDTLSVDETASLLVTALHKAAEVVIGFKKQTHRTSMKSTSLPKHVVDGLKLKRQLESKWKSLSSSSPYVHDDVAAAESAFHEQSKMVDDMFCTMSLSKRRKDYGLGLSGNSKLTRKNFWQAVTGKVKQSSTLSSVLSSAGVLKTDNDEIRLEVEKHLCAVFEGSMEPIPPVDDAPIVLHDDHPYTPNVTPPTPAVADHAYQLVAHPSLPCNGSSNKLEENPDGWLSRDFTLKEVQKIASELSCGKAFGWDMIPSEFLKFAPVQAFSIMALLFSKIKNSGVFPCGWKCGRVTLVHKKDMRAVLGNYRPITVLVSLSGFYSKLLNDRLIAVVETHKLLGEIQNGFRQGRCGADNIFILHTLLLKAKSLGVPVHLGFVDVAKAYDSVNRKILWAKLEKLGIRGSFLETLKAMYNDDSVRCTFNGTSTSSVFLRRGLRQGCSLSPLLFAIYISDLGADLSTSDHGFTLAGQRVAALLFADDIVLFSSSSAGLKALFALVKKHCDQLLLQINTGAGKSEVVSPSDENWDILDDDGEAELSLNQVLQYKYLGLETCVSIVKTSRTKLQKCVKTANKYKFACLHASKCGPDVVESTLATWENIAIPSILFGCESIIFTETTILGIERVQAQIAKRLLGLPANTANVCAQTELGIIPFRLALYKCQLSFYFRVLDLPQSRWVKKALLEHLSMCWPSPYLKNISAIRDKVNLHFFPPTTRYLKTHLFQWSLSEVNSQLVDLSLPYVQPLTKYKRQPYVFEHPHLDTIAQFRLSNAGLGNRAPRFAGFQYDRQSHCPLCHGCKLTESHVVFFCPAVERERKQLDLTFFRGIFTTRGLSEETIFSHFVNGSDWNRNDISRENILDRGLALDTIRGHWLSKW